MINLFPTVYQSLYWQSYGKKMVEQAIIEQKPRFQQERENLAKQIYNRTKIETEKKIQKNNLFGSFEFSRFTILFSMKSPNAQDFEQLIYNTNADTDVTDLLKQKGYNIDNEYEYFWFNNDSYFFNTADLENDFANQNKRQFTIWKRYTQEVQRLIDEQKQGKIDYQNGKKTKLASKYHENILSILNIIKNNGYIPIRTPEQMNRMAEIEKRIGLVRNRIIMKIKSNLVDRNWLNVQKTKNDFLDENAAARFGKKSPTKLIELFQYTNNLEKVDGKFVEILYTPDSKLKYVFKTKWTTDDFLILDEPPQPSELPPEYLEIENFNKLFEKPPPVKLGKTTLARRLSKSFPKPKQFDLGAAVDKIMLNYNNTNINKIFEEIHTFLTSKNSKQSPNQKKALREYRDTILKQKYLDSINEKENELSILRNARKTAKQENNSVSIIDFKIGFLREALKQPANKLLGELPIQEEKIKKVKKIRQVKQKNILFNIPQDNNLEELIKNKMNSNGIDRPAAIRRLLQDYQINKIEPDNNYSKLADELKKNEEEKEKEEKEEYPESIRFYLDDFNNDLGPESILKNLYDQDILKEDDREWVKKKYNLN